MTNNAMNERVMYGAYSVVPSCFTKFGTDFRVLLGYFIAVLSGHNSGKGKGQDLSDTVAGISN